MQIGQTPLIKLERMAPPNGVEIWVKWEGANPTGSMKDRMALSMVLGAEQRGQLKPGGRVVDYTGGSTGSSLAMVCAARGYQAHFVSSDAFSEEKLQTMRAFGARLDVVPSGNGKVTPELIRTCIERVRGMATEPDTFWTDQFSNPDNRAGYHAMADESLSALGGRLDEFVMMVGTAGCFSGNAEVLKARVPGVRCVAGEPAASQVLSGHEPTGGHRIEGTGAGFVPAIYRADTRGCRDGRHRRGRLRHRAAPGARGGSLRRDFLGRERLDGAAAGRAPPARRTHRHHDLRFGTEVPERRSVPEHVESAG